MSIEIYTWVSIVALSAFLVANVYYGLPWYAHIGLIYGLILCVKGII